MNPVFSEASDQLRIAAEECSQLIKEVEEYDWTCGPYPSIELPYPEEDIHFFHKRAWDAIHLKKRVIAVLERLGPIADHWRQQIGSLSVVEVFIQDPLAYGAKRAFPSGLIAMREVLKTANATIVTSERPDSPDGRSPAAKACLAYIEAKALTKTRFAGLCGITDRTIRKFVHDKPISPSTLQSIAKAMGITAEQLLRGEWPSNNRA